MIGFVLKALSYTKYLLLTLSETLYIYDEQRIMKNEVSIAPFDIYFHHFPGLTEAGPSDSPSPLSASWSDIFPGTPQAQHEYCLLNCDTYFF
jgi:hypothetical protein